LPSSAALAATGLTGCGSKVGLAGTVGSHHITDSTVSGYLTSNAKPFSVQSQSGPPATIVPRSYTLTALIRESLFTKALAASSGGVPSSSDLAGVEAQLTQGASSADQAKQYTQYGFKAKFAKLDLRDSALEAVLAQRVKATNDARRLLKAIHDLHLHVTVSGRYGEWDSSQLAVRAQPTDGAPDFVHLNVSSYANQKPQLPTG
jgi:hypothetical protein